MSAAERAVELIERQFFLGLPDTALESAVHIVAALMADPGLLADMLDEADPPSEWVGLTPAEADAVARIIAEEES